jgi:uncharacterized membrane protein YgcG
MIRPRTTRPPRLAPLAALALAACSASHAPTAPANGQRLVPQQAGVVQSANAQPGPARPARPNLCKGRQSPLPAPAGFVSDFAGVIDAPTERRLEARLAELKKSAAVEFAVVTVETTGGRDIFDYSLDVACGWGVGPREAEPGGGVLLLVAARDRRWRVQVSGSLEAALPDEKVKEIGDRMAEHFKRGDFNAGVSSAVEEHAARLAPDAKPGAPKPTP